MTLIIDAHLDLGWNAVGLDRDLLLPLEELNRRDAVLEDAIWRGRATVCFPEMRRGRVALAVATLLARSGPEYRRTAAALRRDLDYTHPHAAYAVAAAHLAWYEWMERRGEVRIIRSADDLTGHWNAWREYERSHRGPMIAAGRRGRGVRAVRGSGRTGAAMAPNGDAARFIDRDSTPPIGLILSMEGADPISDVTDLSEFHRRGLRAVGPAHYGRSRHAGGTSTTAPLTALGRATLEGMGGLGMVLDVTHLSDESLEESLECFGGRVLASHHNCRAIAPHQRQLPDAHIRLLVGRGAVIGLSLNTWMIVAGWKTGQTPRESVTLDHLALHADHICQIAGSADHVGIGSDLDGGFGTEETPMGIDTIADLHRLGDALADRGFTDAQVEAILHGNWLRFWGEALGRSS